MVYCSNRCTCQLCGLWIVGLLGPLLTAAGGKDLRYHSHTHRQQNYQLWILNHLWVDHIYPEFDIMTVTQKLLLLLWWLATAGSHSLPICPWARHQTPHLFPGCFALHPTTVVCVVCSASGGLNVCVCVYSMCSDEIKISKKRARIASKTLPYSVLEPVHIFSWLHHWF